MSEIAFLNCGSRRTHETAPTPGATLRGAVMDGVGECGILDGFDTTYMCTAVGSGDPLSGPLRQHMEAIIGRDLGGIRVHTGEAADRTARYIGAEAFTVDEHVIFRSGRFQPESAAGWQLLRHELSHTLESRQNIHRVYCWFSSRNNPGEHTYVLRGQLKKFTVGPGTLNTHEAITRRAMSESGGFGANSQRFLEYWVAEADCWKPDQGRPLSQLASQRAGRGFHELEQIITNSGGDDGALKLLHCYGGHNYPPGAPEIGMSSMEIGARLTGGGLIGALLTSAVTNYNSGNEAGRENGLILLGFSLHTLQDFFSHKVRLADQLGDLRAAADQEGTRNNRSVMEDDAAVVPDRWWRAKDRTLDQLQTFLARLQAQPKSILAEVAFSLPYAQHEASFGRR